MKTVNEQINEVLRLAGVKPLYEEQLDEGFGDSLKNTVKGIFRLINKKPAESVLDKSIINTVEKINSKPFTNLVKALTTVSLAAGTIIVAGCNTADQCKANMNNQENNINQVDTINQTKNNKATSNPTNVKNKKTAANINVPKKPIDELFSKNIENVSKNQNGKCIKIGLKINDSIIDISNPDISNTQQIQFIRTIDRYDFDTVVICKFNDVNYKIITHCSKDKFEKIVYDDNNNFSSRLKASFSPESDEVLYRGNTKEEEAKINAKIKEGLRDVATEACSVGYEELVNGANAIYDPVFNGWYTETNELDTSKFPQQLKNSDQK